ncbi:MAG: ABC transporter permease [Bacilli bacterium]|nr:ABC transporter permease [Bacilli bacterium]
MTSKFWFLAKQSLNKKIKTKWFALANLLLAVVIIGLLNLDSIIHFFGGDFSSDIQIVLLDKTGNSEDVFRPSLALAEESFGLERKIIVNVSSQSLDELKEDLKESDKIGVVLERDSAHYLKAAVISNQKIDTLSYQTIIQALNTSKTQIAMRDADIAPEELEKIMSNISIDRIILDDDAKSEDEAMSLIMGTVFPTLILPFFMLVVFLVQMIGTEINEEKSTRSMEIIISNVSPKTHFFSKVLASNAFVLIQGILLFLYSGIGILIKMSSNVGSSSDFTGQISSIWDSLSQSGIMNRLPVIIPATLILMILSFIAYSLIAGILASMTVNMEDFQQIQTPIMMICLLGYYLSIMAGMFDGSIFIRVLSYVPLLSCLLTPALLVIGQIGVIDVGISILLLILLIYFMTKYGLKIYKVGILNYSTDKMWKRLWKAARVKE